MNISVTFTGRLLWYPIKTLFISSKKYFSGQRLHGKIEMSSWMFDKIWTIFARFTAPQIELEKV